LETLPAHRALRGAGTILIRDASARSARVYAGICHLAGYDVVLCRPDEVNTQHPREYRVDLAIIGVSEATGPRPALWHASVPRFSSPVRHRTPAAPSNWAIKLYSCGR
jgi:hypothetical protein